MIENNVIKELAVAFVDVDGDVEILKDILLEANEMRQGSSESDGHFNEIRNDVDTIHVGIVLTTRPAILGALVSIIGYAEGES